MISDYKERYTEMLLKKAEMENWSISVTTESDQKIQDILFGSIGQTIEPIKTKKSSKKMSLENLVFIVFGRDAVDSLLTVGFKDITYNSPSKTSKKKSNTKKK